MELDAPPRCRGCEGVCAWRRLPATRRTTLETTLALEVGDAVVVSLPERTLLTGVLLAYGLPLVALLAGALAGWAATASDLGAVCGAAAALLAVLLLTPGLRRRVEQRTLRQLTLAPGPR